MAGISFGLKEDVKIEVSGDHIKYWQVAARPGASDDLYATDEYANSVR